MTRGLRLEGRVAVVTGAGSGIGRAVALQLAEDGAHVVVTSRTAAHANATAAMVSEAGGSASTARLDVTRADEVDAVVEEIRRGHGRIDVLVNNAGFDIARAPAVWETTDEEWERVLDVNVSGPFRLSRAAIPLMPRGSAIVNVGSINSVVAWTHNAAYSTSKGALLQLTRALALDLAPRGIRANCVCPGIIDTPLTEAFLARADDADALRAEYEAVAPLGRLGTAREVATCVAFLASDEASFVTGAALFVDGGTTASA